MGTSYSNPSGMTAEEREQARQEARDDSRSEAVQQHQGDAAHYQRTNEQYADEKHTPFMEWSLDGLKGMLANANAGGIEAVGENWKKAHDQLLGSDGSGSGDCAYGLLKKAVDNVLEHWEGESANQFRTKAHEILRNIRNTGTHCATVSSATKGAAEDLRNQKQRLDALEEPSWFERAGDFLGDMGRDDSYTQEDIQNKNLPKDVLAQIDENYLSEGMEVKLQAAAIMETLGRNYHAYKQRIETSRNRDGGNDDIPPSSPSVPMPAPIPAFSGSSPTPGGSGRRNWSATTPVGAKTPSTTGPRDVGISGGKQVPVSQTKLDSLPTGISGPAADTGPTGGGAARSGPATTTGPTSHGIPGGGIVGGARSGGTSGRGAGIRGGISGTPGGGAGSRGTAAGAGFRGGGAMGGGAGGGRGGAATGRGPLARAKGGVLGAPKGIAGGRPATPGGTGLGKGRGGASGNGKGARGGMLGGRMGSNQRPGEDEREQGHRPDYLIEDEETWTPEDSRSVPRTIE
ncbi:hypothetical protein E4198_05180 [Streptomyces sp. RKND-216]|uniref:hypothetical protein n=1 Tax=Streptomyces sp. RKND-216 TaxID=2562581 RepID=UPI00109DB9E2|nr:hypothetical protein [Streptomyces sp. RKND-216]THA24215.1 hypothetical protein E4198_05180 [Streptomyces sp. RKND-216]